ncbi:MAG: flagellar biosynthesis anti-sigma factor FlgM [Clostridiales bacterium]|jgi:anti-sigma28 factor (negative regulator of flagellin synthesis)|nr:flagellar biosynthesis anti-sigma factor FlgM [Clostridiales bacterium]
MRIDSITSSYYVQNYRSNKLTVTEKKKTDKAYDYVSLSVEAESFSNTLNEIKNRVLAQTSNEQVRINDIKSRIKRGEYNISGELVAEKILSLFQN